ncbi:hypothetical protein GGI35DRAFT_457340 [Trichoderma velutinum]
MRIDAVLVPVTSISVHPLQLLPISEPSLVNMSSSSTHVNNGSIVTNNEDAATTNDAVDDHDSAYSLNRFLSDMDRNHPPGYGQAQSPAESETRMQKMLHSFDAKFPPSSDPPYRSDSASRSN